MKMTLDEALNILHIDAGENDETILVLLDVIASYIEVTTGLAIEHQANEPLVYGVTKLLLTLMYYGDYVKDYDVLQRAIDMLLKAISARVDRH